jgi:hypothetical protein
MTGRLVVTVLLLLVAATAYGMSLRYMYHGVYEIHVILGESQPEPVDEVLPGGSTRRVTISGVFPVMMPSLWLPDGTPGLTYSFTRATALFNITADPKNDFIWYVPPTFTIYYKESMTGPRSQGVCVDVLRRRVPQRRSGAYFRHSVY